ncbi:MAG: beta-galactosidase, partial [Alistipes sp.]|nr:beta-galactosidase [Alistipes sp.]
MRYRFLLSIILFALSVVSVAADAPMRKVYNINDNWRFYHSEQLDNSNVDYISLPHTWQAELGSYGKGSSMANYTRTLSIPQEWMGRRLFLRFEGVQSVARVFVNGAYIGGHKGGFTAFALEITDDVRFGAENHIRVIVGNAVRSDVLPVSTDMDLTAGIFRDVELVVAPRNMISMEHYGSEGVFVVQQSVSKEAVTGFVRSYISAQPHSHLDLAVRIVGPDGYEIATNTTRISKNEEGYVDTPFEIQDPQLWSPKSPALYRVEVSLGDDKYSDAVAVETGFRVVSLNGANDLCINGEAVAVRGVNLSHDRMGYGMALSDRSLGEDYSILSDMGATALRSLSGPHSSELYDWCDRDGRLV